MITQRFNPNPQWVNGKTNQYWFGFIDLLNTLRRELQHTNTAKLLEVGSYMGESTKMFASTGIFKYIDVIEPFQGHEEFNVEFGYTWDEVRKEFNQNTKYFDNIHLYEDFSYNVYDKIDDDYDVIYIDANHDYDAVKQDIENLLPKTRHFIGGHDYGEWASVTDAIHDTIGEPTISFWDGSWIKDITNI